MSGRRGWGRSDRRSGPRGSGGDKALVRALRTAARNGVVLKLDGKTALDAWLAARAALMRAHGWGESEVAKDQNVRADLYAELLDLAPALFRTRGELQTARYELSAMGWGDHLLPDMRVGDASVKPLNRAERRALARSR